MAPAAATAGTSEAALPDGVGTGTSWAKAKATENQKKGQPPSRANPAVSETAGMKASGAATICWDLGTDGPLPNQPLHLGRRVLGR